MTVIWCDPPATPLHPRAWFPLLTEAATRPGVWALLRVYQSPEQSYEAARHLRKAKTRKPAGGWMFRSGRVPDTAGEWGVWARYELREAS